MKGKTSAILWYVIRISVTAGAVALAAVLLWRFEYFSQFAAVDNIVGALPLLFAVVFVGALSGALWMKHTRQFAPLTIFLAALVLLSACLFPTALSGSWWKVEYSREGSDPPLTPYAPYTGEKTARLDAPASLRLEGDLPVLDGSLALYPLYAAFAEAVYPEETCKKEDAVMFTDTVEAFKRLVAGERDMILTAYPAESQLKQAEDAGVELEITPIGKEAFVFLVGDENPLDGLSIQQIYNIYSGKTARWETLGWKEGGEIVALQRPEGSGSQSGIQSIMKKMGLPLASPRPLPDDSLVGTNSLMDQISAKWKGVMPVLGYSYRFFATTMRPNAHAKLLKIEGVAPTDENVRTGAYPFTVNFYAVTRKEPSENTARLLEWILSEEGQTLVGRTGYAGK